MSRRSLMIFLAVITVGFFFDTPVFAQDEASQPDSVSLFDLYLAGSWPGFLLTLLSMASLGMSVERILALTQDKTVPPEVLSEIEGLFEEEAYEDAMSYCEERPMMVTNIIAAGLPKIGTRWTNISEAMGEVRGREANKLNESISYIGLIASVSPLIGLLGTVLGMIATFNTIASSRTAPKPSELALGIQMALVTTCMGLMVAIPATTFFFFLRNKVTRIILEIDGYTEELMDGFREE